MKLNAAYAVNAKIIDIKAKIIQIETALDGVIQKAKTATNVMYGLLEQLKQLPAWMINYNAIYCLFFGGRNFGETEFSNFFLPTKYKTEKMAISNDCPLFLMNYNQTISSCYVDGKIVRNQQIKSKTPTF